MLHSTINRQYKRPTTKPSHNNNVFRSNLNYFLCVFFLSSIPENRIIFIAEDYFIFEFWGVQPIFPK